MKAKVIALTNLKGGIGKTSDNDLLAVVASQFLGKKVLLIDVDQQANSTQNMSRTYKVTEYPMSFTKAVQLNDWKAAIVSLSDNLDFIAGSRGTHDLNEWIIDNSKTIKDRYLFFREQIELLQPNYDYIMFDMSPSSDTSVDAVIASCDYIVPIQELKRFALDGTKLLIEDYLMKMITAYPDDIHFQVAGILPALLVPSKATQQRNMMEIAEKYGEENIFNIIINRHDRIEIYGEFGIQLNDYHDRYLWLKFADIFTELEERIELFETVGDIVNYSYTPKYTDGLKSTKLGKELKTDGINTKQ